VHYALATSEQRLKLPKSKSFGLRNTVLWRGYPVNTQDGIV
jgi:hypothetical protein